MTIFRAGRRRFLTSVAAAGGAAWLDTRWTPLARAAPPNGGDLQGLRAKIDHIVVIFEENRSFDHYFGAYEPRNGATVDGLLDRAGKVHPRFTGTRRACALLTGDPAATGWPLRQFLFRPTVPGSGRNRRRELGFDAARSDRRRSGASLDGRRRAGKSRYGAVDAWTTCPGVRRR